MPLHAENNQFGSEFVKDGVSRLAHLLAEWSADLKSTVVVRAVIGVAKNLDVGLSEQIRWVIEEIERPGDR